MAKITQFIQDIPTPPSSKDRANFRQRADAFLASLDTLASQLNYFATQANSLRDEVNSFMNDVDTKRSEVIAKFLDIVNKYNAVMNYTIPTDATYNFDAIDAMNNTVLTELVRQNLKIQILKQ